MDEKYHKSEADKLFAETLNSIDRTAAELAGNVPTPVGVALRVTEAYRLLKEAKELNRRHAANAS